MPRQLTLHHGAGEKDIHVGVPGGEQDVLSPHGGSRGGKVFDIEVVRQFIEALHRGAVSPLGPAPLIGFSHEGIVGEQSQVHVGEGRLVGCLARHRNFIAPRHWQARQHHQG